MTPYDKLEAILREELISLWTDFDREIDNAYFPHRLNPYRDPNRFWTGGMVAVADRIITITRAVGPCDPDEVQVRVTLDGWWDAVHRRAGVQPPDFDRARHQALRDKIQADR